jgi:hypothetical protein
MRTGGSNDEQVWDHAQVKVASVVGPGEEFRFVFDFGDRWEHRCRVMPEKVDPRVRSAGRGGCPVTRSRVGIDPGSLRAPVCC